MATLPETSTITVSGKQYNIKDADGRTLLESKQDKLTAGEGITIDENGVISAIVNKGGIEEVSSLPTPNESNLNNAYKKDNSIYVVNKTVTKPLDKDLFAWKSEYASLGTVYTTSATPQENDCIYDSNGDRIGSYYLVDWESEGVDYSTKIAFSTGGYPTKADRLPSSDIAKSESSKEEITYSFDKFVKMNMNSIHESMTHESHCLSATSEGTFYYYGNITLLDSCGDACCELVGDTNHSWYTECPLVNVLVDHYDSSWDFVTTYSTPLQDTGEDFLIVKFGSGSWHAVKGKGDLKLVTDIGEILGFFG